ncbi:MAG TPA: PLP-dependent cysteine synthase family protein [Bacillota bacterium]|nr:PLP-dependent cysteine synthase family protein [Bacillota bacterium]
MSSRVSGGKFARSVLDLIGQTPLVRITPEGERPAVVAKAEFANPTGSHKDRIYACMIEEAERRGDLKPGKVIIEGSTGNAGTACAMIGGLKGYRVIVVMPEGMSDERKKLIRAMGAEIIFTPGGESDQDLSLRRIEAMVAEAPDRYWYPCQFDNPDNPLAHYRSTAPELWEQTLGNIDAFLAAVGSGGTLTGVGRYLKERHPAIKLYAVEPEECPTLSSRRWGSHDIQGIGDGFVPVNLALDLVDGVITVSSQEAIATARRVCREQGLVVGISTGCNLAAAAKLAKRHPSLGAIATMLFDTGHKYYTSPLFGARKEMEVPERDHSLDEASVRQLNRYSPGWEIIT